jgi:hypothetical protein
MYQRLREVSLYLETAGLEHRIERRIALQRLAGSDSIAPLEVLLETLAPVRPAILRNGARTGAGVSGR